MALFKTFRGKRNDLDAVAKVDGHAYFCTDDGTFWIDHLEGSTVIRTQINKEDWNEDIANAVSLLNIKNGTGSNALQQNQDQETNVTIGYFKFTSKNPNAIAIDPTLNGEIQYGGTGDFATVFGGKAAAIGKRAFAEGTTTIAKGNYSHAEGDNSVALGNDSHAEGYIATAYGQASHAEGWGTISAKDASHAEGWNTKANGNQSHAEGYETTTIGEESHAEGYKTTAEGVASHAEGGSTFAIGNTSHAEGSDTRAIGEASHAEGFRTKAEGTASHAGGWLTVAGYDAQTVFGKFNANKADTIFEVGCGTSDANRKNAFEVYEDGRAKVYGIPVDQNDVVRLKELQEAQVGKVDYLGTVSTFSGLSAFTNKAQAGDFCRVSTQFAFGNETAHEGDILIALQDSPTNNVTHWDLIHNEYDWTHTHNYTPSGTVSQPTFTGDAHKHTASFTGTQQTVSVDYTPAGSISKPGITVTPSTESIGTITGVGSLPTLTATYDDSNKRVTFSWSAGTLPTKTNKDVMTGAAAALNETPTFKGTKASISHTLTPSGSVSIENTTAGGTVSQPTFSGSKATISHTLTPAGSVAIENTTATGSVSKLTFTGTESEITHSYTPSGTVTIENTTAGGTVSQPTFSGSQGTTGDPN